MKICYDIGILMIDGFDNNVKNIQSLANKLMILGYQVKIHSGNIKKTTYREWIEDVEKSYLLLKEHCEEIVLIGYSMGGLLSLQLAKKFHVKGIITLDTPIFMSNFYHVLKKIMLSPFNIFPIKAKHNIHQLVKDTKKSLALIQCDRLINNVTSHKYQKEMAEEMIVDWVKTIENT